MNKKISENTALNLLEKKLIRYNNVLLKDANEEQIFKALSSIAMDEMFEIREKYNTAATKKGEKTVHYISIEYLLGRTLRTTLANLGVEHVYAKLLKSKGVNINNIYKLEDDAGIGNGGLGRLAACFLESLATQNYPAVGHCIRYDYGLFKQKILDSQQVELADEWLPDGVMWLVPRQDEIVTIRYEGNVEQYIGEDGNLAFRYLNCTEVEAMPYDMMISGYNCKSVSTLRLWSANSKAKFDTHKFSQGEYAQAMAEKDEIESISRVLYPADHHEKGKSLRLKQQYFLTSASMQNIVQNHLVKNSSLKSLPDLFSIHINDTHPAMCIPELMRILMDEHGLSWEESWRIVKKTISYTNHTVLKESLKVWDINLLERYLPRIAMITKEIDRRFRLELDAFCKEDYNLIEKLAIISHGRVSMANLAIVASNSVNGVSKIHSDILKNSLFKEFATLYPNKFTNITNGVTHRRWLAQSNPKLNEFIISQVSERYYKNANLLNKLKELSNDSKVLRKLASIKLDNKKAFAKYLLETQDIVIDPHSRFDVHVKRIHEYKRQLLNVLRIIFLYSVLKKHPQMNIDPQTFIFAGKAAPGYFMAKRIIKLINQLAKDIDQHPEIAQKLKVVFVEDYSVTLSEILMPATDVTQQVSLAGREASGTGNMKAVFNGAIMIGTLDGANAEIAEKCGMENSFIFGLTSEEVDEVWQKGYDPMHYYATNKKIRLVIDMLKAGFNGESFEDIANYLLGKGESKDIYMCLADFESYVDTHRAMSKAYKTPKQWYRMVLLNISSMGYFSSDRSIEEYVQKIWHLNKIK